MMYTKGKHVTIWLIVIGIMCMVVVAGIRYSAAQSKELHRIAIEQRVAKLKTELREINVRFRGAQQRESRQARSGFGLSDDAYWTQWENNMAREREITMKKIPLEIELERLQEQLLSID